MIEPSDEPQRAQLSGHLLKFLSVIYCLVVILLGIVFAVRDLHLSHNVSNNLYIAFINVLGLLWLSYLLFDVWYLKINSTNRRDNFNWIERRLSKCQEYSPESLHYAQKLTNGYSMVFPIHKGNYFTAIMFVFCVISSVRMLIELIDQGNRTLNSSQCGHWSTMLVLVVSMTKEVYQLCIAIRYSNIIINRMKLVSIFALMHLLATSMVMWFNGIFNEAIDDYVIEIIRHYESDSNHTIVDEFFKTVVEHELHCYNVSYLTLSQKEIISYLYPFTIEYNILLASVWYIMWTHIDKKNTFGISDGYRKSESGDSSDGETTFSNWGKCKFGFIILVNILVFNIGSIIIFLVTIDKDDNSMAIITYCVQLGLLVLFGCAILPMAYMKTRALDIIGHNNPFHSVHSMDDFLVLMPIPFVLLYYMLHIMGLLYNKDHTNEIKDTYLIVIYALDIVEVMLQSLFIVDGIRRCSNIHTHQKMKPGRELVRLLMILNIWLWAVNTIERKSVEYYQGMEDYFGQMTWMIISNATLPIMLFYRFHSSICLSDIWKLAYEQDRCIETSPNNGDLHLGTSDVTFNF